MIEYREHIERYVVFPCPLCAELVRFRIVDKTIQPSYHPDIPIHEDIIPSIYEEHVPIPNVCKMSDIYWSIKHNNTGVYPNYYLVSDLKRDMNKFILTDEFKTMEKEKFLSNL